MLGVIDIKTPSINTNVHFIQPSLMDRPPFLATLVLVGIVLVILVVMVGIVRHWRWLFWLLLVAFGCMMLEIPVTILQLTGVLPSLFPIWYSLLRMGSVRSAYA